MARLMPQPGERRIQRVGCGWTLLPYLAVLGGVIAVIALAVTR